MNRYNLLLTNKTLLECRQMGWRERRAYSRRVDKRLRYVCRKDQTLRMVLELLAEALGYGAMLAAPVAFVVMFVRWWLCM